MGKEWKRDVEGVNYPDPGFGGFETYTTERKGHTLFSEAVGRHSVGSELSKFAYGQGRAVTPLVHSWAFFLGLNLDQL